MIPAQCANSEKRMIKRLVIKRLTKYWQKGVATSFFSAILIVSLIFDKGNVDIQYGNGLPKLINQRSDMYERYLWMEFR